MTWDEADEAWENVLKFYGNDDISAKVALWRMMGTADLSKVFHVAELTADQIYKLNMLRSPNWFAILKAHEAIKHDNNRTVSGDECPVRSQPVKVAP